jgi:hypothetical protein
MRKECKEMDRIHMNEDKVQWQAFCKHGNEDCDLIKDGDFLDQLGYY